MPERDIISQCPEEEAARDMPTMLRHYGRVT
jgi:hypothetical protein